MLLTAALEIPFTTAVNAVVNMTMFQLRLSWVERRAVPGAMLSVSSPPSLGHCVSSLLSVLILTDMGTVSPSRHTAAGG